MIYIVAHKEFSLPQVDKSYVPIFVGGGRFVIEQ